jgi:hypothetical protein
LHFLIGPPEGNAGMWLIACEVFGKALKNIG